MIICRLYATFPFEYHVERDKNFQHMNHFLIFNFRQPVAVFVVKSDFNFRARLLLFFYSPEYPSFNRALFALASLLNAHIVIICFSIMSEILEKNVHTCAD